MRATIRSWSDIEEDHPVPLLDRKCVHCEQMLVARVFLHKGCEVAQHRHDSEQTSIIISGKIKWFFEDREEIGEAGHVVTLPAGVLHGVVALEDSLLMDILSPPGPMGVDRITAE